MEPDPFFRLGKKFGMWNWLNAVAGGLWTDFSDFFFHLEICRKGGGGRSGGWWHVRKKLSTITILCSNVQSESWFMDIRYEVYFWTKFHPFQELVNKEFTKIDRCSFWCATRNSPMCLHVVSFNFFRLVGFRYFYHTNKATLLTFW